MIEQLKCMIKRYRVEIVFFAVMMVLLSVSEMWVGSDDTVNKEILQNTPVLEWVWQRATNWQPRIVSDFLVGVFSFHIPLWRILIALSATALVSMIGSVVTSGRQTDERETWWAKTIIACLFFVIHPNTLSTGVFWFSGSFYYLVPTLLLFTGLMPFCMAAFGIEMQNAGKIKSIIIPCVASACCAYMEICAAVLLCFAVFTLVFCFMSGKRIPKRLIAQLVLLCVNMFVYFSLGGTSIRSRAELYWFKDFEMLSLIDRIFMGVTWGNLHYVCGATVLVAVLLGLVVLNVHGKYRSKLICVLAALPLCVILCVIPAYDQALRIGEMGIESGILLSRVSGWSSVVELLRILPGQMNYGWKALLPGMGFMAIILFVSGLVFVSFERTDNKLVGTVIYFAALAASFIMGFSPTIFASGFRVFFVADMLIIFLCAMLLGELFIHQSGIWKEKWFKVLVCFLVVIAAGFAMEQFLFNLKDQVRF